MTAVSLLLSFLRFSWLAFKRRCSPVVPIIVLSVSGVLVSLWMYYFRLLARMPLDCLSLPSSCQQPPGLTGLQMILVEAAQRGDGQPHGTGRVPPLLAQEDEERLHGIFAQRGRITALLPRNGDDIRQVALASAWPQIPQLDKLPEAIYGRIVWIRGLFISGQNTPSSPPCPIPPPPPRSGLVQPCAAANCSGRHSLCSRPQTRPRRLSAQAAPPSAVAELGVGD